MFSVLSKRRVGAERPGETAINMIRTIVMVIVTVERFRECDIRDAAFYTLRGDREALIILIYYTSIDL